MSACSLSFIPQSVLSIVVLFSFAGCGGVLLNGGFVFARVFAAVDWISAFVSSSTMA
jgi:hypothetical protein